MNDYCWLGGKRRTNKNVVFHPFARPLLEFLVFLSNFIFKLISILIKFAKLKLGIPIMHSTQVKKKKETDLAFCLSISLLLGLSRTHRKQWLPPLLWRPVTFSSVLALTTQFVWPCHTTEIQI